MASDWLFSNGVSDMKLPDPSFQNWISPSAQRLAPRLLVDSPSRLLCVDAFLQSDRAQRLADILINQVAFSPRFGILSGLTPTSPNARGIVVDQDEWLHTSPPFRFFRFEAVATLEHAVTDPKARLLMFEFWRFLAGDDFRTWLESISGLKCRQPRIEAHRMTSGDFIRPHSDARADRTVGLFIYLTPGWREEDGGALQVDNGRLSIVPFFNRAVIFDVSGHKMHEVHDLPQTTTRARMSFGVWYHQTD